MQNDLGWRLDSIHAELDCLLMYAAAWAAMEADERRDIRMRWNGLVVREIASMRANWRRYALWGDDPDWWIQLRRAVDDNARVIEYLDLHAPDVSRVERPVRVR